ncbi:MAG: pyruvate kinase [Bacteroidales bacterium]|nr:pyruvate kinase [Bacteroidales bacterium]
MIQHKMYSDFLYTKIIATLGPSSETVQQIMDLLLAGVRVFRINFSHGTFEEYENLLSNVREAEKQTGIFAAVMGDLSGPKIRVGEVAGRGVVLTKGDLIEFVKHRLVAGTTGTEKVFSSTLPQFVDEVKAGERILIDDGNLELVCLASKGTGENKKLICRVEVGGLVTSHKGINLPESELTVPAMTEKDFQCVDFAVAKKFDILALSFVRKAEDIMLLKNRLSELEARPKMMKGISGYLDFKGKKPNLENYIPIIAKIEKPQAIKNLESILEETDGVMVARGDLGVEMDLAEVAILQKKIIHMCREYGKPVIVATQMLQSMIESPVPTRAEVSDVANAIFDGADAVMLSGETAVGKYPDKSVKMMRKIGWRTNEFLKDSQIQSGRFITKTRYFHRAAALAHGVSTIASDVKAKMIITWTQSGGSSVMLSQQRMQIPIIAFGDKQARLRQLSLLYSIQPVFMKKPGSGSSFIAAADKVLLKNKWALRGDPVIFVSGDPINKTGIANRIVIHYVGESTDD